VTRLESPASSIRKAGTIKSIQKNVIDPFDRVGGVRGHRHSEFDYEFSQPWSVYQHDLAADLWNVFIRVFRKIRRGDKNPFSRVLPVQSASEFFESRDGPPSPPIALLGRK
jgi:hypothetical protein